MRNSLPRCCKADTASFEPLVQKYSPRVFATARRYARRESEVEDIVQEVWLKSFQKLGSFRGDAPFEHWLMRLTVRTCYDFLRGHQRNREIDLLRIDRAGGGLAGPLRHRIRRTPRKPPPPRASWSSACWNNFRPPARLVITLLEIEDRSVKEIAELTGWSVPLVKVRAFRARAEMKKCLARLAKEKYL